MKWETMPIDHGFVAQDQNRDGPATEPSSRINQLANNGEATNQNADST